MAKKTVGFVHLEWTCPNCGTRNKGTEETCASCGYAQPDDVQFEQPAQEKLVSDEAELSAAQKGPDIHCFYCGARNPADAETCGQCGGDLTQGTAREKGRVMGAHRAEEAPDVICPSCGTANPADAPTCVACGASFGAPAKSPSAEETKPAPPPSKPVNKLAVVGVLLVLLAMMACCGYFFFKTDDVTGRVESVEWTRSVAIDGLVPVAYDAWREDIPSGAIVGTCVDRVHHTQADPASNAKEVCGTPYTVDEGTGYGKVVQDCEYEVYAEWCEYTVEEWRQVDQAVLSGDDFSPRWPGDFALAANQREGARDETYEIVFNNDGKLYQFTTNNPELFKQAQIGSRWVLTVNQLDGVVDIEPVQ